MDRKTDFPWLPDDPDFPISAGTLPQLFKRANPDAIRAALRLLQIPAVVGTEPTPAAAAASAMPGQSSPSPTPLTPRGPRTARLLKEPNLVSPTAIREDVSAKRALTWLPDDTDGPIPTREPFPLFKRVPEDPTVPLTHSDSARHVGDSAGRFTRPDSVEPWPDARPEALRDRAGARDRESSGQSRQADPQLEAETIVSEEEELYEPSEHDPIPDERNAEATDNTGDPLASAGPIAIDAEMRPGARPPLVAADLREQVDGMKVKIMHEDTPEAIKRKLIGLKDADVTAEGFDLNREVQERSRISLEWSWDLFQVSLFRSNHTGPSAPIQDYCCPHRGCKACVKFDVRSGYVQPQGARWEHNHPIDNTRCQGLRSLTKAVKDRIRDLTARNMTSAQIHREMGFVISPSVLADVRRDELTKLKSGEVMALIDAVKDWNDFDTKPLYDPATGLFAGCYLFHKRLKGTAACTKVLIMDDTACTNHFNLPLVVIIGVDENGRNQVVAFAFLFDRCAERFTDFLQWLFERMESTPLAFVVDRHEGQAKAIRTVFPTARIIYCAKHLGQNISALFGRHYQVVRTFWRLIRLEVEEADWIALLVAVAAHFEGGTPERRMINWLLENMDHYCPERIFELSGEQVSSRVEGFFGVLKQRIEHLLLTLLDLATEIRLLAQECLAKRLLPRRRPFCGADILATEDQMCIGASAARRLQEEVKKLRTWDWYADQSERRAMTVGICCGIARRWKLPCIHLLLSRTDAKKTPLLTLDDFPEWVKLAPLNLGLHGVHEVGTLDIHSSLRAPRCDRNEILAALEPLVNAAVRGCPHAQECIADVLQRFNRRPQVEAGDIFIDPVRTAGPGRQNVHPGLASLLAVMRPPKKAARTDGPAKRFCSYCHGAGHDRRNCPLRLEHEQQGS